MHRALILLAALLLPLVAHAQPPAPVGGDMSNTTTKATGSSAVRKLGDRAADTLNLRDFGAIADGASHSLSTRYPNIAAAQAVCPEATALTQEIDWCAMQAALDYLATLSPIPANQFTASGGSIEITNGQKPFTGSTPLTSNNASLTLRGSDVEASNIIVGADPWLAFGLNNKMGVSFVRIASSGQGYIPGELLTLTGGTQTNPADPSQAAQIQVLTVGPNGEILTDSVLHGGSYTVLPTNPLAYISNGNGTDAVVNGSFSATALTAVTFQGFGTGCVNGETLTLVGGTTPGGTPTPATFTITNAVGGIIQSGGLTVATTGAYGTPPPNPAPTTGSLACVGAQVNISGFTNSGYTLNMEHLRFSANAPGVSVVKAQLNTQARSALIRDIKMDVLGNNYYRVGFDMTSLTNSVFRDIEAINNSGQLVTNPGESAIVIREQNNLLGHYGYEFTNLSAYAWDGGMVDMKGTSFGIYQGIYVAGGSCALGNHCLRFENTTTHGYGFVRINNFYSTQTVRGIEMQNGVDVNISNSAFGFVTTREVGFPSTLDILYFNNVNRLTMYGNICSIGSPANNVGISQINCVHLAGTSGNGTFRDNAFVSGTTTPVTGWLFDSTTANNIEYTSRYLNASINPVTDNGTNNTTYLSPPTYSACPPVTLTNGGSLTVSNGASCVYLSNGTIASGTLILPASPAPNQEIRFTSFATVTALTVQPNTGQVLGAGMPTTITPGAPFTVKNLANRWQRI